VPQRLLRRAETLAHCVNERREVPEVHVQHITHGGQVHLVIPVHQHILESGHVPKVLGQIETDRLVAVEQIEELTIGPRLTKPAIGYDRRGDVQGRLNRDLQRVLDEAKLADIGVDRARACQPPQLGQARLDAGRASSRRAPRRSWGCLRGAR
jgi:hypothetical protein